MKEPCTRCPFRVDVKPFLTAERGEELAYHATNPYNNFTCHKTTNYDEDHNELYAGEKSKECAGFMTLQIIEGAPIPSGFTPACDIVYKDIYDMIEAYTDQENR